MSNSNDHPVTGKYVQGLFTRIAPHYDLMNRLMTGGQDQKWRREVIRRAALPPKGFLLDAGAGTGDLAREALQQYPGCHAIASDFTLRMMRIGKQRHTTPLQWSAADTLSLPFADNRFDAVVSGFLLRNVTNLVTALQEQARVLKPGGWLVALDTTQPQRNLFTPLIHFYMHHVIPWLGWLLTRQSDAYVYLPTSSEHFLRAEDLQASLNEAGFKNTGFRRLNFGTIAIHWGQKLC